MKTRIVKGQAGYIMPLTLAVLVMLTLIAAQVGNVSRRAIDQIRLARVNIDAQYELEAAKAKVLHMLAILPRSSKGLGEGSNAIVPDGRPYKISTNVNVRLQDLRGLLPLNGNMDSQAADQRLRRLLATYGVDAQTIDMLVDSLKDYRDEDQLKRINGAEIQQYLDTNQPAPRNADLLTPLELMRIDGWAQVQALWMQDDLINHVDTHRALAFNPNLATARVLAAVSGIPAQEADRLVKERQANPDTDIAPLLFSQLGDPFGAAGFVVRGTGPSIRVTLEHSTQPLAVQLVVHHMPEQSQYPWLISHQRYITRQPGRNAEPEAPALPPISALRPMIGPRIEYRF